MKRYSHVLAMIVLAMLANSLPAALLNVQILGHGDDQKGGSDPQPPAYQGAGVIGAEGDYWNAAAADAFGHPLTIVSPEKMLAEDGKTRTDVTLTFAGFLVADHWPTSQGAPVDNALLNSYLACGAGASVMIENLVPQATYDLCLFGNNSHAGLGADFAVGGSTPQRTLGNTGAVFTKGVDYVEFKGIPADQEGRLKVTLSPTQGEVGIFNGFQLRGELPPPSLDPRRQSVANIETVADQRAEFITDPKISFRYGGTKHVQLPDQWKRHYESCALDANRTKHTMTRTDPKTGLAVRVVGVEYLDYPAVEWTVYFKNTGTNNTPVLKNIQALDVILERGNEGEFVLHGIKGDWMAAESYQPYRITLGTNELKTFTPSVHVGKSTSGPDGWPYYNLQMPGGGVMLAVGWPGQWASSFSRDAATGLKIKAGQQLTHLSLRPGEEIRTPLIAMLFWRGTDVVAAQNIWRRWYMAYSIPRFDGQPQQPVTQIQVCGTESDISLVDSYLKAGIKPDVCWRDAFTGGFSWYPSDTGPYRDKDEADIFGKLGWLNTGTWEIDSRRLPRGFKPFSDWIHARGMKFLLWFEPERVGDPNSWLGTNHPEWILPGGYAGGSLLNEGNKEALKWLIDHVDRMITSQGIDWYREDMNCGDNVSAWRSYDADDRQGMTENLYVQGHLAFWDELRRRHPQLRIDSCASGGRRADLESMRRGSLLTRSDFQFPTMPGVVEGNQSHTYGLSFWLPWQGNGCYFTDTYSCRSFYLPGFGMSESSELLHPRTEIRPESSEAVKKAYDECATIAPYMLCDYYPLTRCTLELDQWIAWQFNRPEQGDGMVQAFRRSKNDELTKTFRLHGLDPTAQYKVTNFDVEGSTESSGNDLMEKGLTVEMREKPGAAVIVYNRLTNTDEPPFSQHP